MKYSLSILIYLVFFTLNLSNVSCQNLPPLTVEIYDSSATEGYYFLVPYSITPPYTYDHALTVLDKSGNTVYFGTLGSESVMSTPVDFKLQQGGFMSFFSTGTMKYYMLDSTFTIMDSLEAANGYTADPHELQILDNGHYLLLATATEIMDLSSYYWFGPNHNLPGDSDAEVIGTVIQEFDQDKNLVFEWSAFDHFEFGDVYSYWLNSPSVVDWTHSNALEYDYDGNILLSSRHLNEITKINRENGSIIWRMGGKNNQFTFTNDPVGFTGQHDIRRLDNGNITLWDNGQYTEPPVARALEYEINETVMTVKLVWEFIYDSAMYSSAMGNFQQLPGGNKLINPGFSEPQGFPMFTLVDSAKNKIMDVFAPDYYASYRSFNYRQLPWQLYRPQITCEENNGSFYLVAEPGYDEYLWNDGTTTQSLQITGPGKYQVFVPYGNLGYAGSEIFEVKDPNNPCETNDISSMSLVDEMILTVSPNPATKNIEVKFNFENTENVSMKIFSATGVLRFKAENQKVAKGINRKTIDVSNLPNGIYFLEVCNSRYTLTTKFVISGDR